MAAIPSANEAIPAEGSLLPGSFRQSLQPALVFVSGRREVVCTPQARQMLKLDASPEAPGAGGDVPAPLLRLAEEAAESATGVVSRTLTLPSNRRPGELILHASALRLPGQGGVVLVLHDLKPARRIEEALLQADRLANIGTISASMAHEVRNAMVACRTFIELLLEKHQESELAGVVRREIQRMDDMVSRMLRHSSTAPGKRTSLHLHEVLENALRLLDPQFAEKSLRVERSFAASPDLLEGDEHQLQQAFMNLLLNACEAAPVEGALKAETCHKPAAKSGPPGIWVTISDNGPGIPRDVLPRLFEPFFTTKADGTGLGLAVTQRILKEHGGTITVESQPGQGASFRLFLPV